MQYNTNTNYTQLLRIFYFKKRSHSSPAPPFWNITTKCIKDAHALKRMPVRSKIMYQLSTKMRYPLPICWAALCISHTITGLWLNNAVRRHRWALCSANNAYIGPYYIYTQTIDKTLFAKGNEYAILRRAPLRDAS